MTCAVRKMMPGMAAVLAFANLFMAVAMAEQGVQRDWSYSGLQFPGPAVWGDVRSEYAACKTGRLQSPINVLSASVQKSALPQIEFQYPPTLLKVVNTGH